MDTKNTETQGDSVLLFKVKDPLGGGRFHCSY